jgi:hypothetical protein
MVTTTDIKCGDCGYNLKQYDMLDRNGHPTGETHEVCPNEWNQSHP